MIAIFIERQSKRILRANNFPEAMIMPKPSMRSVSSPSAPTKHEQEMAILLTHHERIMKDAALREAMLVGAGIFIRNSDGKLAVAKPYEKVIVPKLPT